MGNNHFIAKPDCPLMLEQNEDINDERQKKPDDWRLI
jgi:hypothetical protein